MKLKYKSTFDITCSEFERKIYSNIENRFGFSIRASVGRMCHPISHNMVDQTTIIVDDILKRRIQYEL